VDARESIKGFLGVVRRTLTRRTALYVSLLGLSGIIGLGLLAPVLAWWAEPATGPTVARVVGVLAVALMIAGAYVGFVRPRKRWAEDRSVARFVGSRDRSLASDLLSAVELTERPQHDHERVSADLIDAMIDQTAARMEAVDAPALVPVVPVRRARLTLLVAVAIYGATYLLAPAAIAGGWKRLVTTPERGPFDGAALSETPLVGDINLTLIYPLYTQREQALLPSTSGDVRVMPGTTIRIETRALAPVDEARIVFGEFGASDADTTPEAPAPIEMSVEGRVLRAEIPVLEAMSYRFLLGHGGALRTERSPHRIEIETDTVPEVELYAPADELDVTSLKRIELAYIAKDDYGIAKIELVIADGANAEQRKVLPLEGNNLRGAQSKYILDLAEVSLTPGARVAYHVEVTDNDTVLGPNVGKSREFFLRVFSPRERHEEMVARQQELFEKLVRLLGTRLVVAVEDVHAHRVLQRETATVSVEIGGIIAGLEADALAAKELGTELIAMRKRLDKLTETEAKLLDKLEPKQAQGGVAKFELAKLGAGDAAQVTELEDDVLLLAGWLDRQRLELVLALTDEIKGHQDRLRELFKEYARTGSEDIKKEIERELRALDQKLAELAKKQAALPTDVIDQFVNADAMRAEQMESCTEQVRKLLAAGDAPGAQKKMEECAAELEKAAGELEDSLSALRGDKFSEQEKKFGQLMNDLADLARDQNDIAEAADDVWERYADRADEMMRDKAKDTKKKLSKTITKLSKQLDKIPGDGLTPFSKEELDIAKSRVDDIEQMLEDGDIAEALAMARQAQSGLETMDAELESALDEEPRGPWAKRTREARKGVHKAQPLADELVEELEASTPRPEDIMSSEDRRKLDQLRRQQQSVRDKSKRLGKRAQQEAADLPGESGKEISQRVTEATGHMERAGERMRARDPSGARQEAREAAEQLEEARKDGQGAARQQQRLNGGSLRDEPVRIPGADEYKAPEKFREDILEAMKKDDAPDGFGNLVKRYYEELIR
jgi:hypothetical protein